MDPITITMLVTAVAGIVSNANQRDRDKYDRNLNAASARLLSQYQQAYSKINSDQNDIAGFLQYVSSRNSELGQALTYLFGSDRRRYERIRKAYRQAEAAGYAQQHALNQAAKDLESEYKQASDKIVKAQKQGSGLFGLNSFSDTYKEAMNTSVIDPYHLDRPISQAYDTLKKYEQANQISNTDSTNLLPGYKS